MLLRLAVPEFPDKLEWCPFASQMKKPERLDFTNLFVSDTNNNDGTPS
jgi:hypothetical protein